MEKGSNFAAKPFRWDLTREEQLGRLVKTAMPSEWDAKPLEELERCCAKVAAYAGNSRLVFVGRSPESLFDYMSGLLTDTSWADRLILFYFSMRFLDEQRLRREHSSALSAMRAYMQQLDLHPQALTNSKLPIAFVDLVASGETFHNLI